MKRYFATQVVVLSYPELFDPEKGRNTINRKHNKAVKDALESCLRYHQKYNLPKHFKFGAHAKYKYKNRSERTQLIKSRFGKRYLDLVLKGKSKQKFTKDRGRIRIGGNTYSGVGAVNATLTISWPPGYYDRENAKPSTVKKRDMVDEIERWTESEKIDISRHFIEIYLYEMKKALANSPRLKKKYSSQIAAQGIG